MLDMARKKQIDPAFGRRLRVLRETKGWTQTQLGEKAGGMGYQEVARIERGEREPTWSTAIRLAEALGVTPNAFICDGADDGAEDKAAPKKPRK
jgi:transcriptional regulator with XRE-family HTH domain